MTTPWWLIPNGKPALVERVISQEVERLTTDDEQDEEGDDEHED